MSLKLLALGDLHIGRTPTRLPASLTAQAADFGPASAWMAAVDLAVRESVDAVLMAGDLVESTQDYFEGLAHLQRGAQKLREHNIRLIVITGNHDVEVLPRLVDELPDIELLGRNGQWQNTVIDSRLTDANERVRLWGWSFPSRHFHDDPLADFPGRSGAELNLGLLHCDRDQPTSAYAPVTSSGLANAQLDAWLLGHIHQPDALTAAKPFGYLGTVSGLDAGESGARGAWLMVIDEGQIAELSHIPIAPLRWDQITIDCTGAEQLPVLEGRLTEALRELASRLNSERVVPQLLGLRLHLTGETAIASETLADLAPNLDTALPLPDAPHIQWFVERQVIDLRPAIALETLAQRNDQPGLLAQKLLILQRPANDAKRDALLNQAALHARTVSSQGRWQHLPGPTADTEQLATWLRQSAQDALRAMLANESNH